MVTLRDIQAARDRVAPLVRQTPLLGVSLDGVLVPIKPDDAKAAKYFLAALDRTYELYKETGRKLPVANFSNILLAIIAPTARRLMCDISPCGGGRCFFALATNGDMFPCSEFIGLKEFRGGNLFRNEIEDVLQTKAFRTVTDRKVEDRASAGAFMSLSLRTTCSSRLGWH